MGKVYKLEKEYISGDREHPINPITGKTYSDPQIDLHIMSATSLDEEVKRLVREEPWEAIADNPVIAPIRKKAKPLSYGLIYLAGASTIAKQIASSTEEAEETIKKYFSYPDGFYGLDNWLKSTALLGSELRWIKLITGDICFISESNSKGSLDANSAARKACNTSIQGLASIQSKLALVKAQKLFNVLDEKYSSILNGKKAEIISVIHDEICALIPGECFFELVPDVKLNEKNNTDCYIKFKTTFDNKLLNHKIGIEYSEALKLAMTEAMTETFDIINSEIPAASSVNSSLYWVH